VPGARVKRRRVLGACLLGASLLACQSAGPSTAETVQQCAAVTPRELPSGAAIGSSSIETDDDGIVRTTWGSGRDSVTIYSAFWRYASPDPSSRQTASADAVRGHAATILDIGHDGPDPVVGFAWSDGTCAWTVHLGRGNTRADAVDYASRF
jgi:hypothetical protein